MPKYKNTTTKNIYLTRDNKIVKPNEEIITESFYDDIQGLELIDIHPYKTPILLSEINNLNQKNQKKEYNVFPAQEIYIKCLQGQIKIYLHEDNDNGNNTILIEANETFKLSNRLKRLRTIYIENPNNTPAKYQIILYSNDLDYFI